MEVVQYSEFFTNIDSPTKYLIVFNVHYLQAWLMKQTKDHDLQRTYYICICNNRNKEGFGNFFKVKNKNKNKERQ